MRARRAPRARCSRQNLVCLCHLPGMPRQRLGARVVLQASGKRTQFCVIIRSQSLVQAVITRSQSLVQAERSTNPRCAAESLLLRFPPSKLSPWRRLTTAARCCRCRSPRRLWCRSLRCPQPPHGRAACLLLAPRAVAVASVCVRLTGTSATQRYRSCGPWNGGGWQRQRRGSKPRGGPWSRQT